MWSLGTLSFASPWVLAALLALPAVWWLIRATPPAPRREPFPAFGLLAKLKSTEEEPARTPLWLIFLRLALGALLISALADPLLIPKNGRTGGGPLLLVVDNDWAAASDWRERRDAMRALIDEAARANAPVGIMMTAAQTAESPLEISDAAAARARVEAEQPVPWPTDRAEAAKKLDPAVLRAKGLAAAQAVWLSNGLDAPGTDDLLAALKKVGNPQILVPTADKGAVLLTETAVTPDGLKVHALRGNAALAQSGLVRAVSSNGRVLGNAPFNFAAGAAETFATLALPRAELNEAARIEIVGVRGAGAVQLLDEASRKRRVGLVSGDAKSESQPLLSDVHYLQRALSPFADISEDRLDTLLQQDQSMIVLADVGRVSESSHDALTRWIEAGGTLLRFAGPRVAEHPDDLLPVTLRQGGRILGGSLSWSTPQGLAPFEPQSPFAGLEPSPEVKVSRQVLAEPMPDLAQKTWARLADGTPLVTAARRGNGLVVLFHVSANTAWSNLPLSGLYADMLQRLLALSHAARAGAKAPPPESASSAPPLAPATTLDGFGVAGPPPPTVLALPASTWRELDVSPRHPPGLYGPLSQPVAFNVGRANTSLAPLQAGGETRTIQQTAQARARSLKPALLTMVFGLALIDMLVVFILSGALVALGRRFLRSGTAAIAVLTITLSWSGGFGVRTAAASDSDSMRAALAFHLAYVKTGNATVDAMSEAGLNGLGRTLAARTAVEPAEPMGVTLERDELAFFPLLYWQISADQPELSDTAVTRLESYLKHGGTLMIDTADADQGFSGDSFGGPNAVHLRRMLARVDLPPLEPMSSEHVLTKSFYLLKAFPGRHDSGRVWVERSENGSDHDGVATVIIGSNDWASAWARDDDGRPLAPLEPGGEDQREWAMRFGVNLVMYALTGNYKADQVHVPALLERLGQ